MKLDDTISWGHKVNNTHKTKHKALYKGYRCHFNSQWYLAFGIHIPWKINSNEIVTKGYKCKNVWRLGHAFQHYQESNQNQ